MNKYEAISLSRYKGVNGGIMENLGKINIISGPNNSGKTTVLECIAEPKRHSPGQNLKEFNPAIAEQNYLGNSSWNYHTYSQAFQDAFRNTIRANEYWYSNDLDKFSTHLEKAGKIKGLNGLKEGAAKIFTSLFKATPKSVFIPAKRKLDTSISVISGQEIAADGQGILNYLFSAKNQADDSNQRKTYNLISEIFTGITGSQFDVFINKGNNLELDFRIAGGRWLKAEDCGLGLRDLLVILYFSFASEHEVILLEEPESHLHPDFQRKLINAIREKSDKQFFISTHSNVFLSTEFADKVFSCRLSPEGTTVENVTSRASVLAELGYSISDNLVSDLIILCEGPSDKPVIEEFLSKRGLSDNYRIRIWPLGGDIMAQLDLSVFKDAYRLIALIDNDPKSKHIREAFSQKCDQMKIPIVRLEKYAIENYFTIPAISSVIQQKVPGGITTLTPKRKVSEQLGFDVKKHNRQIARAMSLSDIRDTDLSTFFDQVEKMLKS